MKIAYHKLGIFDRYVRAIECRGLFGSRVFRRVMNELSEERFDQPNEWTLILGRKAAQIEIFNDELRGKRRCRRIGPLISYADGRSLTECEDCGRLLLGADAEKRENVLGPWFGHLGDRQHGRENQKWIAKYVGFGARVWGKDITFDGFYTCCLRCAQNRASQFNIEIGVMKNRIIIREIKEKWT